MHFGIYCSIGYCTTALKPSNTMHELSINRYFFHKSKYNTAGTYSVVENGNKIKHKNNVY